MNKQERLKAIMRKLAGMSRGVLTLLPPISFTVSFFLLILASPPLVAVPGDQAASMQGNGSYSYQPPHHSQGEPVYSQAGLAVSAAYYLMFQFYRNFSEFQPIYLQSVSLSSGIRAPPFTALSAH
jgi:hypothetical protein